jgi:hypothetical protein
MKPNLTGRSTGCHFIPPVNSTLYENQLRTIVKELRPKKKKTPRASHMCSKAPALTASGLTPHFTSLRCVKRLLTLARCCAK